MTGKSNSKSNSTRVTERTFERGLESLSEKSQQLWSEPSFKGLIKKFAGVIQADFDAEQFTFLTVDAQKTSSRVKPGAIRIPGTKPLDDETLQQLREHLSRLDLSAGEFKEGISSLMCGTVQLHLVTFDAPVELEGPVNTPLVPAGEDAGLLGVIVWKEGPLAAKSWASRHEGLPPSAMVLSLEFLARQLQSECRWFKRLDQTQAQLYRDDLTGLFNYRYLDVAIDSELRRVFRFRTSFCLLFIDLDNFKPVNDVHGHLSGSSVLRQVAGCLRRVVREVDSIIRYGGDEYVVVLLGASSAAGHLAAERIRREIEANQFVTEDNSRVSLSASIGVACCPEHAEDKETLLRIADEAMYRSKRGGKNQVTMAESVSKTASPDQKSFEL
jgi:diguanylate cyclase (GGDEF)-like protein